MEQNIQQEKVPNKNKKNYRNFLILGVLVSLFSIDVFTFPLRQGLPDSSPFSSWFFSLLDFFSFFGVGPLSVLVIIFGIICIRKKESLWVYIIGIVLGLIGFMAVIYGVYNAFAGSWYWGL